MSQIKGVTRDRGKGIVFSLKFYYFQKKIVKKKKKSKLPEKAEVGEFKKKLINKG